MKGNYYKGTKINIIMVEKDNHFFNQIKNDIKKLSPYIGRIFRCSVHDDVYEINNWEQCKLIIAHNPENSGLDFFKEFYLKKSRQELGIYGLLYTHGHEREKEIRFIREIHYLHEKSTQLFIGAVYKRFGSLEKLLEVIRNIACHRQDYPIIEKLDSEVLEMESNKLEIMRNIHNLTYSILEEFQPFVGILTEFNEDKNIPKLRKNLKKQHNHLFLSNKYNLRIIENIRELIPPDSHKKITGEKFELGEHIQELTNLVKKSQNGLYKCLKVYSQKDTNFITRHIIAQSSNGTLKSFLLNYKDFSNIMQKFINELDKLYFLKRENSDSNQNLRTTKKKQDTAS